MAKKETKRKAFNFLRSYFDVLNELEKDEDKLNFLLSVINKQFLNEDPKDLNFVVNLCYQSQRHQIETSVKGYQDKTGDILGKTDDSEELKGGSVDPTEGGAEGASVQEEEKEKEEEKEQVVNIYRKFEHLKITFEEFDKLANVYGNKQVDEILDQIENFKKNKKYKSLYLTAKNWLKNTKTTNTNEKGNSKTPKRAAAIDNFFGIPGQ